MGIADRDYIRSSPASASSRVGTVQMWSATTWLIVINVAVFVLNNVFSPKLAEVDRQTGQLIRILPTTIEAWCAFAVGDAVWHLQVWRFITYQFLHANLTHLIFNMFTLYFFGPIIEAYLGRRRYLAFYLLSGIGGGVMYVILSAIGAVGSAYLVGASAGIFGVLIGTAVIAPNATVLIYGSIPAKLKTLAWIFIAIAVFTILSQGPNAGGEAAHLGGAVVGFALIRNPRVLNVFQIGFPPRRGMY